MLTDEAAQRPRMIFLHNLKTGGTTLRDIVSRQYEPSELRTTGRVVEIKKLTNPSKVRAIQGHLSYGIHAYVPGESTYATLLRDPVERIISLYSFLLEKPNHAFHPAARSGGLEAFVTSGKVLEVDNGQTRRLSGMHPKFGRCSEAMLEVAKANLDRHFAVVGTTERFDESLLLLKRAFGWRSVLYFKRKVTKKKPKRGALSSGDLATIEAYNELDAELYAYAADKLARVVDRQGPEFRQEVRAFETLNALCQRWEGLSEKGPPRHEVLSDSPTSASQDELWAMLLDAHTHLLARQVPRDAASASSGSPDALASEVRALRRQLASAQHEIRRMRSTKLWRLNKRYWRVRGWVRARLRREGP